MMDLIREEEDELFPHVEDSLRNGDFPVIEVQHTSECHEQMDRQQAVLDAWVAQYPNYCRCCKGSGEVYCSGGFYEPPTTDPCGNCTEQGLCARCMLPGLTADGDGPCSFCGWCYDDRLPDGPECICWVDEPISTDDPFLPVLNDLYDRDVCPDLVIDRRFA